jgi:translation initiation factor 1
MNKTKDPFAALEKLRASLPPGNERAAAHQTEKPVVEKRGPARAVVRMERKGRGGKEATVIEKLELPTRELEQWCKELKQALGCGGTVENDTIVLQGDLRQRVAPLLTARHVGKVTIG